MSFEAVAWALDAPVGGTQKVVLIGIASHADKYGDNAWPSIETLAGYAHVDGRSVQRAINDLVKAGLLFKAVNEGGTRSTPGHMRPNLYRVSMSKTVAVDPLTPASPHPVTPVSPGDASVTPPVTPVSPPPLTPVSPEQSYEPPIEPSIETHTTGNSAGEGESVGVCGGNSDNFQVAQTLPGMVCKAMKAKGIADPNPGHPKLLALLQAGADLTEFTGAAADAVNRKKGFAYALGMVANRRAEVANMAAAGLHQGALPAAPRATAAEPAWRTEQKRRMQQACPRIAAQDTVPTSSAPNPITIDVEARHVPSIALG